MPCVCHTCAGDALPGADDGIWSGLSTACAGSRALDRAIAEPCLSRGDWLRISRSLGFSPQQAAIIRLIIEDLDPKSEAIAMTLGISRRSVETQLQRIYTKLGVRSRAGMVARVLWEVARMREGEVHRRSAEE